MPGINWRISLLQEKNFSDTSFIGPVWPVCFCHFVVHLYPLYSCVPRTQVYFHWTSAAPWSCPLILLFEDYLSIFSGKSSLRGTCCWPWNRELWWSYTYQMLGVKHYVVLGPRVLLVMALQNYVVDPNKYWSLEQNIPALPTTKQLFGQCWKQQQCNILLKHLPAGARCHIFSFSSFIAE